MTNEKKRPTRGREQKRRQSGSVCLCIRASCNELTSPPRPLSQRRVVCQTTAKWRKTAGWLRAPRGRWCVYNSAQTPRVTVCAHTNKLVCTCRACWCTSVDAPSLHHTSGRPCSPGEWPPGSSSFSGLSPTAIWRRKKKLEKDTRLGLTKELLSNLSF